MKKLTVLLLFFVSITFNACQSGNSIRLPYQKEFDPNHWQLVWSDEFDGEGLPKDSNWVYETGYIRNREYQFYTNKRVENSFVQEGKLTLRAQKEQYLNPRFQGDVSSIHPVNRSKSLTDIQTAPCTSASINTFGKQSFLYGRIEVRAKVPAGKGVWPAIWLLGTNHPVKGWPLCGEIDIMEYVGKNENKIHGTVHYPRTMSDPSHRSKGRGVYSLEPYKHFHTYAIEWNENEILFFLNNTVYFRYDIENSGVGSEVFRKPHYLLLNLAIGGSWGGPVDPEIFPSDFVIDYVRYYRRNNES